MPWRGDKMDVRRLAKDGVLTALALGIFVVELQLPALTPIPGVKPGLSNIVTVAAMFTLGPADAGGILACRLLLGALFAGNMMALLYSAAGGTLAYVTLLIFRRVLTKNQIWVASVFAAMAHNVGQVLTAIAVTSTPSIIVYLPVLLVSGVAAGLLTGLAAQYTVNRLGKHLK